MALQRVSIPSPNYSGRGGAKVRLVVVHTSEGAQTYQSLGNFFANPSSGVSSQVGIDDAAAGVIGEYVSRSGKAWTQGNANPVAVSAELCTPSGAAQGWSADVWASKTTMLANCAAWIAEECAALGIPIVKLTPQQAQSDGVGVCGHGDLGSWGGGHTDPGPNFPWTQVLAMAAGGAVPSPEPEPPEVPDMKAAGCVFTMDDGSQQMFYVDGTGRLMHYYWIPGKAWTGEGLSTGWDPDTELIASVSSGGAYQVWGVLASGKRAQTYFGGSAKGWVTQPLG